MKINPVPPTVTNGISAKKVTKSARSEPQVSFSHTMRDTYVSTPKESSVLGNIYSAHSNDPVIGIADASGACITADVSDTLEGLVIHKTYIDPFVDLSGDELFNAIVRQYDGSTDSWSEMIGNLRKYDLASFEEVLALDEARGFMFAEARTSAELMFGKAYDAFLIENYLFSFDTLFAELDDLLLRLVEDTGESPLVKHQQFVKDFAAKAMAAKQ